MGAELAPLTRRLGLRRRADDKSVRMGNHGHHTVLGAVIGIGPEPARARTEALLDAHPVDQVVVIGVAGGLPPHVALGDVVVPEVVVDDADGTEHRPSIPDDPQRRGTLVTMAGLVKDGVALRALADQGVVALDMETAAVAEVCERRRTPWSVFRGISDDAFDPAVDDAVLGLTRPDGSADPVAVGRFLAGDPARARLLRRLARDLDTATGAAVGAALAATA